MSSEKERILEFISEKIARYGFSGAVIGISGGIDSAVVGKLLTEALGKDRVYGLLLPERDSSTETIADSRLVCKFLGINHSLKPITPLVRKLGVYRMKPPAGLFPRKWQERYAENIWKSTDTPYINDLKTAGGDKNRRNLAYYRTKHRLRMVRMYFEAEKRGYAVIGTTNLTEFLTGFYIKWGDDSTDIEPIIHLYKTDVFTLGRELGIPKKIIEKKPSPDIAPGITDEFALGMDYKKLDRILKKLKAEDESGIRVTGETDSDINRVKKILEAAEFRNIRNLNLLWEKA
ncbi:MAG: NAD(+) synthase [Spirochaetales bacterium]|uniref:NH(3)-dependent NAD(+) synthetase n=1 Tax=Candidatus Thalassospirochaeta sargassi TaxID=3119039 RepID=A0AAJ1MMQ8_9SPIO|nr:NAD(+) synthase [Spirochaetales bacterium]